MGWAVLRGGPIALTLIAVTFGGCASADARLVEGRRLSAQGEWRRAVDVFREVRGLTCSGSTLDERCKAAFIGQAEAYLRLDRPQDAYWVLAEGPKLWPPDRPADERMRAIQKDAQQALAARLARRAGQATLRVGLRSETRASFTPIGAALTLDLIPIPLVGLNDAKQGPVTASTVATAISAGEHELEAFTKYASGGRLPPDCRIMVRSNTKFEVADGDAVEIQVLFSEKPVWSSVDEAITVTFEVHSAPAPK